MPKFYFTFGCDHSPYHDGWVVVKASDERSARAAFAAYFPCKTPGILACAFVYDEETFKSHSMFEKGNFGARCHAVIEMREGDFEE